MSETMNARGVPTLESRLLLNDQMPPAEDIVGSYNQEYQSNDIPYTPTMTITRVDVNDGLPLYYYTLTPSGETNPWKTSYYDASVILDVPTTALQFTVEGFEGPHAYASLCTLLDPPQTCLVVYYKSGGSEPNSTGIWLGTSSGGGSWPYHKDKA